MPKAVKAPQQDGELVARNVRPDAKHRLTLGKVIADLGEDVHFNIYLKANGQILLDPQVSVPAAEAWLYRNAGALAAVRRGLEEAGAGKARKAGSFAKFADET